MLPTPHPAVLFQRVADGAILLHTEQEIYFGLNSVGAEIWQLLPPVCSDINDLCVRLRSRYSEVPEAELHADVAELLRNLANEGLVEPVGD